MWEIPHQEFNPCNIRRYMLQINATHAVKIAKLSIKRSNIFKMREFILETNPVDAMDVEVFIVK